MAIQGAVCPLMAILRQGSGMLPESTRRNFLGAMGGFGGIAAGALITGFDPASRTWIADDAKPRSTVRIPKLKGRLLFDQADRSAAADDFGHIVHRLPQAVLQPGDIEDVAVMLRFCGAHRIPAAPRGQAHATNGQAQVTNGLVIETATLDAIDVGQGKVTVGAGARWSSVLQAT